MKNTYSLRLLVCLVCIFSLCFFSCQKNNVKNDTQKYLQKICEMQKLNEEWVKADVDRQDEIDRETELLGKEIEALNTDLLNKYGQDSASLHFIQEYSATYQCK